MSYGADETQQTARDNKKNENYTCRIPSMFSPENALHEHI